MTNDNIAVAQEGERSDIILKPPDLNPSRAGLKPHTIERDTILSPLQELYRRAGYAERDEDMAYIPFARKTRDGSFENLFSLTIEELDNDFRDVMPFLTHDAYFTVNAMYRAAPYLNPATGFPGVWRRENHLRYLNACYVDLDIGREEGTAIQRLSTDEVTSQLRQMIDDG